MSFSGGIFSGLKVIDLASFIAGPAAAVILGDFGAEVIKVEPPSGDPFRNLSRAPGMPKTDFAFHQIVDNRNKRSITLDLNKEAAREVLYRLVAEADVLVSNHRPALRAKLKTRYEDFIAVNPKLIFASITGYGETGPEANKAGFDSTALWARTGLMDLVKPRPDSEPARSLPGMGDHPTAVALFAAIVTGLYQRDRTGEGMHVSTSLVSNGLWSNAYFGQAGLLGAEVFPRPPREEVKNAVTNHYQCRDGRWFMISMVSEDREWERFCHAIGRPEWLNDPRFQEKEIRHKNAIALATLLDALFAQQDWPHWRERLEAARITFGPVARVADLANDEQMRASGALVPAKAPGLEGYMTIDSPLWVDGTPKRAPGAVPDIGEHNDEILREAGYGDEKIEELRAGGALG